VSPHIAVDTPVFQFDVLPDIVDWTPVFLLYVLPYIPVERRDGSFGIAVRTPAFRPGGPPTISDYIRDVSPATSVGVLGEEELPVAWLW